MGTGADVAVESAAMTLVEGDLQGIVRARQLSQATMSNIRQNLFFAFVFNALAVPIAAGVIYPWCPYRKSDANVLVTQSAEMRFCEDPTDALNFARNRRVLVQRQMRAGAIVICHVR